MKNGQKTAGWHFLFSLLGLMLCLLFWGMTGTAAEDSRQGSGGSDLFDIEAQLLSSNGRTYDIQVTAANQGADWEGTVCVVVSNGYSEGNCTYDTVLSLPQGSTKQFVVRIPKESVEYLNGAVHVALYDKESKIVLEKAFKRLLMQDVDMLSVGILSDTYQSLTYLDLEGEAIYYGGSERPVKLLELDSDHLVSMLDSMICLVIDNYDTSTLADGIVDGIEQWVNDGGILVVGTGKRAEDTLGGLDFMGMESSFVMEPEEADDTDYYNDLQQFHRAVLQDLYRQYHQEGDSLFEVCPWGKGAIEITPYALSDLGQQPKNWDGITYEIFYYASDYVRGQTNFGNQQYEEYSNILRRIFRMFGNGGSRLNFGGLKWIVVLYVLFVGPVLYLILRAFKKRDWYWIAVPVTALVGIFLVYCAGSGFEVVNTRVFSVTVENLSDQNTDAVTYMHCYDAGHKEWELQMADRYAYMGSLFGDYYGSEGKYHVRREGDRITFGLNPSEGFEDSHFVAGTTQKQAAGSITSNLQAFGADGITGTVTNGTEYDFEYFAVLFQDTLYVWRDLPAGATCDLDRTPYVARHQGYDSDAEAYLQGYINDVFYSKVDNKEEKRDIDIIAALGTGVSAVNFVEDADETVIIGVTQDWYKAVDDNCTETSYGCLYAVQ